MGVFELRMSFPGGTYTGHRADGSDDPFPDPVRVFSALVQSAYTGTTAMTEGELPKPSAESLNALKWLENNPPDALHLPESVPLSSAPPTAFRKEGLIRKEGNKIVDKTSGKATDDGMAVNGTFGMSWNQVPPEDVVTALDSLCADVSHLGEALSPAVLEAARTTEDGSRLSATWLRDPKSRRFTSGGLRVRIPKPGRLEELEEAHRLIHLSKPPTAVKDRHAVSEDSVLHPVPNSRVRRQRFVRPARPTSELPWSNAIVIAVDSIFSHADAQRHAYSTGIPDRQRVEWCVAMHRALVKRISGPAPAFITGTYPEGFDRPANRLAIQYLDPSLMTVSQHVQSSGETGAFLLLIPSNVASDDLLALESALTGLSEIRSRHGVAHIRVTDDHVSCERFWNAPAAGMSRLRLTVPAMVPDVRKQRSDWSLADTVLAAIGFTWRDQAGLGDALSGPGNRYRRLVDKVSHLLGPTILEVHRLPVDGSAYVHRLPPGVPAEPFRALIDFADQLPVEALAAIGQSRHLGGGLLVPVDLPAGVISFRIGGLA